MRVATALVSLLVVLVTGVSQAGAQHHSATPAAAQDPAPADPVSAEERTTGLPKAVEWTFNFDATWGSFGFANSLYQNPKEDIDAHLSDQWFEGSVKPALSGRHRFDDASELYGKLSAVGERTYGAAPDLAGDDVSSFKPEDFYIGWRSKPSFIERLGQDNTLDISLGRVPYKLGHGMLLSDGAAEGGSRGGYWTNARKAFSFGTIARFTPGPHLVEGFYLDKDDLPENDIGTRLAGINYEYRIGEHSTLGATYMKFWTHSQLTPERDGLNVINLRAYVTPVSVLPQAAVEFEYASERNGNLLHSNAWTLQGSYELSEVTWKPALTYRYAFFQGDDGDTARNESFDPLLPGFHDWGTWWQGEIAGEYFLANSNLMTHMARVHVTPADSIGGGLIFFKFLLDRPETFAPGVTATGLAFESDLYVDWKINTNFTASFVTAFANPQTAARQAFDRTRNFGYGMVFLAYSY
jgi:hypothetical protein